MGSAGGSRARPASVEEALEWFRKRFRPDAARGVRLAWAVALGGSPGEGLTIRVDEGRLELRPEVADDCDVVFRMSAADFFGVLAGTSNPDLLFMEDRLRIDGDLSLALKLRTLFSNPA